MAAKKNPLSDKAYEMYKKGMKLVDIADQLGKPEGTIRRWKSTYEWDGERSESKKNKSERSDKKRKGKRTSVDDGTRETLQNDDLTPERQMFCIYYSRTFNATQSYLNAFHCSYDTANAEGYKLLVNPCVRAEIERLKEIKRQQILAGQDDLVELQMRIAFSDIGNYLQFGRETIKTRSGKEIKINVVNLKESNAVDTQIIKKVKEGKDGISVEVEDRQKAIDWLTRFFEMNPMDRHKKEFDKHKLELELLKMEMQTKENDQSDQTQDNFLDALNESAREVWSDE